MHKQFVVGGNRVSKQAPACARRWIVWFGFWLMFLGLPEGLRAVEISWKDGAVIATDQGKTLWETRLEAGDSDLAKEGKVIPLGGVVLCSTASRLVVVDLQTGTVKRMKPLPAKITDSHYDKDGTTAILKVQSEIKSLPWTREYHVTAAGDDIPFMLPELIIAFSSWARVAEYPEKKLRKSLKGTGPKGSLTAEEEATVRTQAVTELDQMASRNSLDPYIHLQRGLLFKKLGKEAEAESAFKAMLALDPAYDYLLLRTVLPLEIIAPAASDEAFKRSLKSLIDHGYEPENCNGLINLMVMYGGPDTIKPLDAVKDIDALNRRGERLWALAPYCEWIHPYYTHLAAANKQAGREDQVALWLKRAALAQPIDGGWYPSQRPVVTGHALSLYKALIFALIAVVIFKGLRYIGVMIAPNTAPGWRRFNPFSYWSKGELVGTLLLLIPLTMANTEIAQGVGAIAIGAAQPISNIGGLVSNPSAAEWWHKHNNTAGGKFCEAFALQKSGDLAAAEAIYGQLNTAGSMVNIGVIREAQGKPEDAKALYERALQKQPGLPEALYNLGKEVHSDRVDRHIAAGASGKLLVLPSAAEVCEAFEHPTGAKSVYLPFLDSISVDENSTSDSGSTVIFGMILVAVLAALVALFTPRVTRQAEKFDHPAGRLGWGAWGLGWLVPGIGRAWWILGPAVTVAFLFSWDIYGFMSNPNSGGATNPIQAIAIPNLGSAYGTGTGLKDEMVPGAMDPLTKFVQSTTHWWWILMLLNIVVLAVGEFISRDPIGPFAKRPEDGIAAAAPSLPPPGSATAG